MSGRTYTQQANWFEVFKFLEKGLTKKASAVAESIAQQQEEFLNRYVVTATDDSGSITFDAAGTYTFAGDVVVTGTLNVPDKTSTASWHVDASGNMWSGAVSFASAKFSVSSTGNVLVGGNITLSGGTGVIRSAASGYRVEMGDGTFAAGGSTYRGLQFFSASPSETVEGWIGVTNGSGGGSIHLDIRAPYIGSGAAITPSIQLTSQPSTSSFEAEANNVYLVTRGVLDLSTNYSDPRIQLGAPTTGDVELSASGGDVVFTGSKVRITNRKLHFGATANTDYLQYNSTSSYWSVYTANVEKVRFDSSGNIGQSGNYHYFAGVTSGNYIYATSTQHNIYINSALEVSVDASGTTFNSGGADSGVFVGKMFNTATYSGIGTAGMTGSGATGSEYMIMSDGVNTFVSGGSGGQTRIRPGNNGTSGEIRLDGTWAHVDKPAFTNLPTATASEFRLYVTSTGEVRKRSTAGL